jgi:hypothetical protein
MTSRKVAAMAASIARAGEEVVFTDSSMVAVALDEFISSLIMAVDRRREAEYKCWWSGLEIGCWSQRI